MDQAILPGPALKPELSIEFSLIALFGFPFVFSKLNGNLNLLRCHNVKIKFLETIFLGLVQWIKMYRIFVMKSSNIEYNMLYDNDFLCDNQYAKL